MESGFYFLTIYSYMPILVTSILQMKGIEKRSGSVSVIYWEYTASWCGRNRNRNIGRLVTCMSSTEKEGRQVMELGYQASRSAGTDLIFSSKVPLPKCSTRFKRAPQSGEQIFKHKSLWRLLHINATIMSNLVKFKAACLQENLKFEKCMSVAVSDPWNWNYREVWNAPHAGIEPQSSRAASALSHWAISPAT